MYKEVMKVQDIRLQELVAALQLLVLSLYCFHSVDNSLQAGLQHLCLCDEIPPCVLAKLVDLLAVASGRHGADVVVFKVLVHHGGGRITRDDHGATAFSAAQFGTAES